MQETIGANERESLRAALQALGIGEIAIDYALEKYALEALCAVIEAMEGKDIAFPDSIFICLLNGEKIALANKPNYTIMAKEKKSELKKGDPMFAKSAIGMIKVKLEEAKANARR